MHVLIVIAHPLQDSLCRTLAQTAIATLEACGHAIEIEDLYGAGFAPALTAAERASYYDGPYDAGAVTAQIDRLLRAEALVLVFPTWWFGMPAMLKGWFDRVWAPGVAYDHASDLGPIRPRLDRLRRALAITTLGSPWWVDRLVMRQPVRKTLKTALLGTCAPACRFEMLSSYRSERLDPAQVQALNARVRRTLTAWR